MCGHNILQSDLHVIAQRRTNTLDLAYMYTDYFEEDGLFQFLSRPREIVGTARRKCPSLSGALAGRNNVGPSAYDHLTNHL